LLALSGACSRVPQHEARTLPHTNLDAATAASDDALGATAPSAQNRGAAVIELFTSEGCSSCPPADRVLAGLAERAKSSALPIYALSFHVDYWNYLGWRDRFSSANYSERQHGYASIAPNGGTYTPQAVVNGEAECVGSDSTRIDALVERALTHAAGTRIELSARRVGSAIEVSYSASGETRDRVLNLALVEPHAESAVRSGENAGEQLSHVNVVRAFVSRSLASTSGSWSIVPSADFGAGRVGVVAYAEGNSQRDISGANALELE
jgi:hypothetical protein